MNLQFTNSQIYFCISNCWSSLSLKLQYAIYTAIAANNTDDTYLQTIDVTSDQLLIVYSSVGQLPESICNTLNTELKASLLPQIMAIMADNTNPDYIDAYDALMALQELDDLNNNQSSQRMMSGKSQILS